MVKPTINSDKHYVQSPVFVVTNGARTNVNVVTVDNALGNASDVRVGAVVKAVYCEYWVDSASASKTVNAVVYKRSSGAGVITYADMQNLTAYSNKNNVFVHQQGLAPSGGNTLPLFRQWIPIPKGKQRMAIGDIFGVSFAATGANMNICGFSLFKEYF